MSKAVVSIQESDRAINVAKTNASRPRSSFSFLPSTRLPLVSGPQSISYITKPLIQPKLKIGAPNGKYEQEADHIADMVVDTDFAAGDSSIPKQSRPIISRLRTGAMPLQRTTESPEKLEDGILQTKSKVPTRADTRADLKVDFSNLGTGSTLPAGERERLEQKFGFDFSRVRIHSDHRSAAMANSIRARAFTLGRNIVFGRGEYMPGTKQGRRLLAHELTHVVQQGQARSNVPFRRHYAPVLNDKTGGNTIRRMAWNPNADTGQDIAPWRELPRVTGDLLDAATDAGTSVNTWLPHDGTTYWCHGYTFGGSTARGGPYSIWGRAVPGILNDDGWRRISYCNARNNDILVFYGHANSASGPRVAHSGIIRSVSSASSSLNERRSMLESKWGPGSHNMKSWSANVDRYGFYHIFSKTAAQGLSCGTGSNEFT